MEGDMYVNFNPRTTRGATRVEIYNPGSFPISIHAPHGVRRSTGNRRYRDIYISTHAPHTGCDDGKIMTGKRRHDFNPRT